MGRLSFERLHSFSERFEGLRLQSIGVLQLLLQAFDLICGQGLQALAQGLKLA